MKRIILMLLLMGIFVAISTKGSAQMSISYYSSSFSKIGIAYNFSNRFWSEIRLYSNTTLEDITPELVICYNLAHHDKYNIYLGVGGNVNYYSGLVIPAGLQFTPFEKLKNFSFHIEFQPMVVFDQDVILQSSWGIRYKF